MSFEYTNRKGVTYYLRRSTTKRGKTHYAFSRKPGGEEVEALPDGYEVRESINGQVSLAQARPDRSRRPRSSSLARCCATSRPTTGWRSRAKSWCSSSRRRERGRSWMRSAVARRRPESRAGRQTSPASPPGAPAMSPSCASSYWMRRAAASGLLDNGTQPVNSSAYERTEPEYSPADPSRPL